MQRILSRAASAGGRLRRCTAAFSTDAPAVSTEDSTFVEAWRKVAPNIDPPKTPLAFMKPRPPIPSSIPTKLTVNFVLPYKSELANKEVFRSQLFLLLPLVLFIIFILSIYTCCCDRHRLFLGFGGRGGGDLAET